MWKSLSRVWLFATSVDYTVHGLLQGRILEWVASPFSRGSSQPRDQTQVSRIAGGFFTSCATREILNLPTYLYICLSPNYLSVCLSVYEDTYLPCLSIYPPTCLPVYLPTCLSIYLFAYLPTYPRTCLIYISIYIHTSRYIWRERGNRYNYRGLPWWLRREGIYLWCRRPRFDPWVGRISWKRAWQPTAVFLPGESHGQRSLVGLWESQRVWHNWVTNTFTFIEAKIQK